MDYDGFSAGANPIETLEGIAEIRALSAAHDVDVRSLCADYLMNFPLVRATDADRLQSIGHLIALLGDARRAGVQRIVLPFVDSSTIFDPSDRDAVIDSLARILPAARAAAFLNEGARASITGRDALSVFETTSELSAGRPDRVMSFAGDLSSPQVLASAKRQVTQNWEPVYCLVCNIGNGSVRNGWNLDREDWNTGFDINFWATVGLVKAFLPDMA